MSARDDLDLLAENQQLQAEANILLMDRMERLEKRFDRLQVAGLIQAVAILVLALAPLWRGP